MINPLEYFRRKEAARQQLITEQRQHNQLIESLVVAIDHNSAFGDRLLLELQNHSGHLAQQTQLLTDNHDREVRRDRKNGVEC